MGDDQSFIICSSAEILIVAKLEKVSDTAYGKMICSLCLIDKQTNMAISSCASSRDSRPSNQPRSKADGSSPCRKMTVGSSS